MVLSPEGFRPERDYAGEDQQQQKNYRPVLSSDRALENNKPATV
jgi:hypothetical protein